MVYYTLWETGETACERECLGKFYLYTTENLVFEDFSLVFLCDCIKAAFSTSTKPIEGPTLPRF